MKKVAIFTRHLLTPEQRAGIDNDHCGEIYLGDLAKKSVTSSEDGDEVVEEFLRRIGSDSVKVYGVIPTFMRAALLARDNRTAGCSGAIRTITTYEALNFQRSVEGEKPTFSFGGWIKTGYYKIPSRE
ncbi:MAG: hypothetical protein LC101_08540 [Flavobacteriales bacterium]|nr:hypothetical protein [Flavobacteriales bacterium]